MLPHAEQDQGSNCQLEAQEGKYELIHCSTAVRGGRGFNCAWLGLTEPPWVWECCGYCLAQRDKLSIPRTIEDTVCTGDTCKDQSQISGKKPFRTNSISPGSSFPIPVVKYHPQPDLDTRQLQRQRQQHRHTKSRTAGPLSTSVALSFL